jgi:hypothetical protein
MVALGLADNPNPAPPVVDDKEKWVGPVPNKVQPEPPIDP